MARPYRIVITNDSTNAEIARVITDAASGQTFIVGWTANAVGRRDYPIFQRDANGDVVNDEKGEHIVLGYDDAAYQAAALALVSQTIGQSVEITG